VSDALQKLAGKADPSGGRAAAEQEADAAARARLPQPSPPPSSRRMSARAPSMLGRLAEKFYYDFSLHKKYFPNTPYNKYVVL
jgi:hypothetical protein